MCTYSPQSDASSNLYSLLSKLEISVFNYRNSPSVNNTMLSFEIYSLNCELDPSGYFASGASLLNSINSLKLALSLTIVAAFP